jgi:tetratricopeptide (TPR) repeat protein
MKAFFLASATLLVAASPAQATVLTVAGSYARSCYTAAEARVVSNASLLDCDRALSVQALTPDDIVATHVNRGVLHLIAGDAVRAGADFDRAIAMNPAQAEAWLDKSVLALHQGDSPTAMQFAERAIELGTRKPALALYVRAAAKEDAGDVKAAYNDLLRAAQLDPRWMLPRQELARFRVVSR